ncbi:aminopeptidase [uncultured Finegoldia sp.]|uniref:aminopeptidase n=1 Tax=uncultured Finegoldia sp. TaxID=328009 RepID=UPI002605BE56|nr:aminopeptidase [uncultured Finegoldia sp.]
MQLEHEKTNIWNMVDEKEHKEIYAYGERYKNFLDNCKTEREATQFIINQAKQNGFIELKEALKNKIKKGDKIFINNKGKSCVLAVIGDDINEGLNIVGAHIDCPRLDLRAVPFNEDKNILMMKTHYYGGIKKHQWTTIPLAMHGVIFTNEGKKVEIKIGEKEDEPVFYITELLAHLSKDLNAKTLGQAIEGEKLSIIAGHDSYNFKDEKENPIKKCILKYLNEKYSITESDFQIAEIEIVPATKARDVGFDGAMIAAHGHDDRVCSYATLEAILKVDSPKRTAIALFVDKEEIGSVGNTSMKAPYMENMIAEIANNQSEKFNDLTMRRILANSKVLSADVTAAIDPLYSEATEDSNTALCGCGISIAKFTGHGGKFNSNDANPEFLNELRELFEKENVIWQTTELGKIDQGGGGTIAYILANKGAEVVDMGTAMLSMHAPVELLSKADCYMTSKAYHAFLK